jgi:hypothetical protein
MVVEQKYNIKILERENSREKDVLILGFEKEKNELVRRIQFVEKKFRESKV